MKLEKIIQVTRRFSRENWGGIESAVLNTSIELEKRNIKSPIYCTNSFKESSKESISGIEIYRFKHHFPWIGLSDLTIQKMEYKGGNPLSYSLFKDLMLDKHISILHTHILHRLGGIVRTVSRLRKIPYVVTIHAGYLTTSRKQFDKMEEVLKEGWEWGKAVGWLLGARRVVEDADAVICVGLDEYKIIKGKYPDKPVYHLPNGVDLDFISQGNSELFRKAHQSGDDEKIILCVSRIDYQKNQLLLVKAFAKFVKEFPNYRLFLIGPVTVEAYAEEIKQTIGKLGINKNCTLIPGYSHGDLRLADAYQAADCFVLPSSVEPFGIVVLEAWAAKKPVIASYVGGIPGFATQEENILFFDDDNEEQLLQQMRNLANNSDLAVMLGNNGYQKAHEFSWDAIVDKLIAIYEKVLKDNQS